jgi:hypothetical protein
MIVTDLQYGLENRLLRKLDLMIARCEQKAPKKDALLICEGGEGEGKTNTSLAIAYYIKSKTNRDVYLFFRLEAMIKFAQSTEEKIIIWDEPALDALKTDWYKKANEDLIRLLMVVRKKRHFFIFNFTKFYKFSEYIVVDRALGLIHMYSRKETDPGRFVYIRKRMLELLYNGYRVSKKRLYKKLSSIRGDFPEVLEKLLDKMNVTIDGKPNSTFKDYDYLKDQAIFSIGKAKPEDVEKHRELIETKRELLQLKINLSKIKKGVKNQTELAKLIGYPQQTVSSWANKAISDMNGSPVSVSLLPNPQVRSNLGVTTKDKQQIDSEDQDEDEL